MFNHQVLFTRFSCEPPSPGAHLFACCQLQGSGGACHTTAASNGAIGCCRGGSGPVVRPWFCHMGEPHSCSTFRMCLWAVGNSPIWLRKIRKYDVSFFLCDPTLTEPSSYLDQPERMMGAPKESPTAPPLADEKNSNFEGYRDRYNHGWTTHDRHFGDLQTFHRSAKVHGWLSKDSPWLTLLTQCLSW